MDEEGSTERAILLVEDEPGICEVGRRVLTGAGFKVDTAPNGDVAKEILGRKEYQLIIIDMRTPVMNGRQLYEIICEKFPSMVKKVIFTSGDMAGGSTQAFFEKTGRVFLSKPFTPDELKSAVEEAFRRLGK